MLEIFKDISLNRGAEAPLYLQLYGKLKEMMESGLLVRDYKLPSIRQLSSLLGVNLVTVVTAFKRLEEEGLIYKRQGSGCFVAGFSGTAASNAGLGSLFISDELYQQEDIPAPVLKKMSSAGDTINFASATPTSELFPVDDFKLALNEVLERDKGNAFSYQEGQGFLPLRESISLLLEHQGIKAAPEALLVISGAQQGIDIISKALLRQGDCVITESPTYTGAAAVFKSRGAKIIDLEMKEDGPEISLLEYNFKKYKPRVFYTIPSFHNPTGFSYAEDKRRLLLALAEKYNTYIIEDDYVSELSFEGDLPVPLRAIDPKERVIFIKSFSKLFMPGLRLGFMSVPQALLGIIAEAKHTTDISTSGLLQRAFDTYIRKGFWDRHFQFMYDTCRERYYTMINALDKYLKAPVAFSRPGGGLNIWLTFPSGFPVDILLSHAASNGVVFSPGRIFYSGDSPQRLYNLRLSFASVGTDKIEEGIRRLCREIDRILY